MYLINVDPGSGKEPWEIAKKYHNFVGFDREIRRGNPHLAKKIPYLSNRDELWLNNNPAMIDQAMVDQKMASPCFHVQLRRN